MQAIFGNPLAEPGVVGVSAGAALGAAAAIVLGVTQSFGMLGTGSVAVFAFVGGLLATLLVYAVSRSNGRTEVVTLHPHRHRGQRLRGRRARVPGVRRRLRQPRADRVLAARLARRIALGRGARRRAGRGRRDDRARSSSAAATTCSRSASATPATSASTSRRCASARSSSSRCSREPPSRSAASSRSSGSSCRTSSGCPSGPAHRPLIIASAFGGGALMVFADLLARTVVVGADLPIGTADLARRRAVLLLPAVPPAPPERGLGMTRG